MSFLFVKRVGYMTLHSWIFNFDDRVQFKRIQGEHDMNRPWNLEFIFFLDCRDNENQECCSKVINHISILWCDRKRLETKKNNRMDMWKSKNLTDLDTSYFSLNSIIPVIPENLKGRSFHFILAFDETNIKAQCRSVNTLGNMQFVGSIIKSNILYLALNMILNFFF